MRGTTIRARLLLLVLAVMFPILLFSAVLLARAYRADSALVRQNVITDARQITLALDTQIGRVQAIVQALAGSPLGERSDPATFEAIAGRALVGTELEARATVEALDLGPMPPAAEAKQRASGLLDGAEPFVLLHIPITRDGAPSFDVTISITARSIAKILAGQTLPPGWYATVVDRSGHIIARPAYPARVGQSIAPALSEVVEAQDSGYAPTLARNGDPVYVGFGRSALTGWLVTVTAPRPVIRGPLLRSLALLAAGDALLLIAGLTLAWLLGRTITRPLHALAHEAARLGAGVLPSTDGVRGVAEAEEVGRALHQAGQLLIARDAERDTALRRAEASEARLLLAQEAGAVGAWETDCITGHRTWSPRQYQLYGVDPASEPPHGEGWPALIHPDDRDRIMSMVARAYRQPMQYQHEFRVMHPGGEVRWLRSAGMSLFRDGRPQRLVGITLDTTERHEAERALREGAARLEAEVSARTRELAESESRFRTYFDYSADALMVVRIERDGRFVYETMNRSGERLTGLSASDIAGKTPEEVLLPETAKAALESYRQVARTAAKLQVEQVLTFPSRRLELETVLVPVSGPSGVARIIVGHRDLTERRRLEGRLSHAQRLEAVGQLTGGVAHDFNNLLTVVIGNLSLLRRRLGNDERAARYLTSVETAAERGAKLTASLLAFSRRQTLSVAPLDVGALLAESATLLRRALGEEIEFSLEIAPALPPARTDAAQLEAAVLNLAINARDAINAAATLRGVRGGTLRIAVQPAVLLSTDLEGNDEARPGRFVAIQVQDDGIGMTPEVRARAFEPFFTTKEIGQGTGLGLSQVFGFVRQLGGHVTLESTPGHGTRAVLYLPEASADEIVEPEDSVRPLSLPAGATVLVVEDDDGIRAITAEVLGDAGLHVLTAPNGPAALAILRGPDPVDLLFSDVVMPGGATGVDLAQAARALRPHLAVLLTSGYGGPAPGYSGADAEEYELLAKPYTRSALLERIGSILAGLQPAV